MIIENGQQHVARLRCRVGAAGRDLSADTAGIFRNDLPERVTLNRKLLSGLDPVIQPDQQFDKAATARDRDKLRQAILEGLGWKLHRIWSTDWWHDSDKEMETLRSALAGLRQERGGRVEEPGELESQERSSMNE